MSKTAIIVSSCIKRFKLIHNFFFSKNSELGHIYRKRKLLLLLLSLYFFRCLKERTKVVISVFIKICVTDVTNVTNFVFFIVLYVYIDKIILLIEHALSCARQTNWVSCTCNFSLIF